MIRASSNIQKAASGWPPVAPKNLRLCPSVGASVKQKGRRVAAPRRSIDGTCEKPPTDRISLARWPQSWSCQYRYQLRQPPNVYHCYPGRLSICKPTLTSVTSLWADEHLYYPLHVEPGTLWVYLPTTSRRAGLIRTFGPNWRWRWNSCARR